MAKSKIETEKVDVKQSQVVNSGRKNHYIVTANNVPFGEVSGDTISVLDVSVCGADEISGGLLTDASLMKREVNRLEVREAYKTLKENMKSLNQQGKKEEAEKLKEDYISRCRRVSINFGLEKMLCIREFLILNSKERIFIQRFQKDTLERTRRYKLQAL